jgi:sec-independent protein translocase protein TatA
MRTIGPMEVVLILCAAALLFGGKKIPELMKGVGEGIKNFKTAIKQDEKPETQPEAKKQA